MQEEEEELEWQWANSGFGLPVIWASWRGTGRDARVYSNEQMTGLTLGGPTNVAYVADDHPTNGEVVQWEIREIEFRPGQHEIDRTVRSPLNLFDKLKKKEEK